jgi:hypothetical protein
VISAVISARLQPVGRELELAVRADLAPAERSRLIAQVARDDITQIDRDNDAAVGTDVKYRTFVDGSASDRLETVNPDHGVITAAWDLGTDVVARVGEMLREHSPVGSGRDPHPGLYRDSHILFADGVQVKAPDPSLSAKEWVYISGVPYARKIELRQADGVYEAVAALAPQRYGNQAKISFTFRSLAQGGGTALDTWAKSSSGRAWAKQRSHRRDSLHGEWLRRQPAIVIKIL